VTDDNRVTKVTLCLTGGATCPTVEISATRVDFRDDFGGHVRLTREEWAMLVSKIKQDELA
jgi:hypothetical protein